MKELTLTVPAMWADHHVLAVRASARRHAGRRRGRGQRPRLHAAGRLRPGRRTHAEAIVAGLARGRLRRGRRPRRRRSRERPGPPGRTAVRGPPRPTPPTPPCPATIASTREATGAPAPSARATRSLTHAGTEEHRSRGARDAAVRRGLRHRHRLHPRRRDEALPHRRSRSLLSHLQHGALPPGGQGRRGQDRHLRRRPADDRRQALRPPGRGRRGGPLRPRPRHGHDPGGRRQGRGAPATSSRTNRS